MKSSRRKFDSEWKVRYENFNLSESSKRKIDSEWKAQDLNLILNEKLKMKILFIVISLKRYTTQTYGMKRSRQKNLFGMKSSRLKFEWVKISRWKFDSDWKAWN